MSLCISANLKGVKYVDIWIEGKKAVLEIYHKVLSTKFLCRKIERAAKKKISKNGHHKKAEENPPKLLIYVGLLLYHYRKHFLKKYHLKQFDYITPAITTDLLWYSKYLKHECN